MIANMCPTGFSTCLCYDLRFNVRGSCTPGSENEFVDIESFQMMLSKLRRLPLILLLFLMLEVVPLNLLLPKIELLLNLLKIWKGLFREVMLLLTTCL
jgi:hypothetical protein